MGNYEGQRSIYVVIGPPASGKTTWINGFVKEYSDTLRIDTHIFDNQFEVRDGVKVWYDLYREPHYWSREPIPEAIYHIYRCAYWSAYVPHKHNMGEIESEDVLLLEPPLPLLDVEARAIRNMAWSMKMQMVYVWCNADLEVRLRRNEARKDRIPDSVVKSIIPWESAFNSIYPDRVIWNNTSGGCK